MENLNWFNSLNKPFLSPPDWLFTPVWIILYITIAVSFLLFLKSSSQKNKKIGLIFFFTQLLLNFIWSPIFFNLQNILGALIIIFFMWLFILLTIITFIKHSKIAGILLIPYLIWVSFAFYLNFGFYVLN